MDAPWLVLAHRATRHGPDSGQRRHPRLRQRGGGRLPLGAWATLMIMGALQVGV